MAGRLFARPSALRQSVTFSQTRYASRAVPTFHPSSSSELDEALNRFRDQVFIPHALPRRQRLSMFKEKHAKQLEQEPIVVNVNETEEYTLRPMNLKALPTKYDAGGVLKMMVATKQYKNLLPFTTGLWKANYHIPLSLWEYLIRHARQAGCLQYIVECARQRKQTGLPIEDPILLQRLFFELHVMAQESNYDEKQVNFALNSAKQILDIMEMNRPTYGFARFVSKEQFLGINGLMLELHSAQAIHNPNTKTVPEAFLSAQKLITSYPVEQDILQKAAPTAETDRPSADQWVRTASLVYSGLNKFRSIKALESEEKFRGKVKSRFDNVKAVLTKVLQDQSLRPLWTPAWTRAEALLGLQFSGDGTRSGESQKGKLLDEKP